ncbi:hypothetical protein ACIQWZ_36155 [Streptomyces sp. NPDC098077]|uniref:hypothetical protein n=1 Tax=Streptomyces sp. NPDC098077 TaxID=3366093 RepID=UPI0038001B15
MKGKSDPIDVYAAATIVLSGRAAGPPRSRLCAGEVAQVRRPASPHLTRKAEIAELDTQIILPGLDEINSSISRVLIRTRLIERAIELYLSTADRAATPRPALLPDAKDSDIASRSASCCWSTNLQLEPLPGSASSIARGHWPVTDLDRRSRSGSRSAGDIGVSLSLMGATAW